MTEVIVGAWGARATLDGLEGVSNPLANLSNQPVELLESGPAARGAALRARAGFGRRRASTAAGSPTSASTGCAPERATLTIRSDRPLPSAVRARRRAPGGALPQHVITVEGRRRDVAAHADGGARAAARRPLPACSAGGGGFGSPLDRDPERGARGRGRREGDAPRPRERLRRRLSRASPRHGSTRTRRRRCARRSPARDARRRHPERHPGRRHGSGAPYARRRRRSRDGRIVAIGQVVPAALTELDARGLAVAPGFVDIHSHSDYTLLSTRARERDASGRHAGGRRQLRSRLLPDRRPGDSRQRAIYGHSPGSRSTWRSAAELLRAARGGAARSQRCKSRSERPAPVATVGLDDRPASRPRSGPRCGRCWRSR